MRKLRILYLSGLILIAIISILIYTQILETTTTAPTPKIEHSSVKSAENYIIRFNINNNEDRDLNYTYSIFLDDDKLTSDSYITVKAGRTSRSSLEIPSEEVGSGRVNVLIYKGTGESKVLMDNKTYYLK